MKVHPLKQLLDLKSKHIAVGIYSACTANSLCIEAALEYAKDHHSLCLIEATANQVNQNGGYTGLKPKDFASFVYKIAEKVEISKDQIILGGDHLGPLTWSNLSAPVAMENAKQLISEYVLAGFTKIHIDTTMRLANDPWKISNDLIIERSIELAKTIQSAYVELSKQRRDSIFPILIIGSEVPIPGGAQSDSNQMHITTSTDLHNTIHDYKNGFIKANLESLWNQVIGIVAQPGVEEADLMPVEYDRVKANDLMRTIQSIPNLVMEGHSTDYQTKTKLREMVEDGVGILKVGPALTFALREGLFALSYIEDLIIKDERDKSHFRNVLDEAMLNEPSHWKSHYHGCESELFIKRQFSFSDRCRYYLPVDSVEKAIQK